MYGYEYSNARLRAMRSRLLRVDELETLAGSGTLENMLTALAHTAYEGAVQAALVRASDLEAISTALSQDQRAIIGKIRAFFNGEERDCVRMVLGKYDVHNLKAIFRGLAHGAPPPEIRAALLMMGDMTEAVLVALTQAADLSAGIDLLVSMRLPQSRALLTVWTSGAQVDVTALELALDRWYFQHMAAEVTHLPGDTNWLARHFALQADTTNLLTVLRLVHAPLERALLPERLGVETVRDLLVGPGRLSFDVLVRMTDQSTLEAAIDLVAQMPYYAPLRAGQKDYENVRRLSAFERHLRRYTLRWRAGLSAVDPLGIGMLLSYLALKENEVANLRWIAHAVGAGLEPEAIKAELELVA